MIVFRRQFLRRVRLRNLVLITLILILLYLLRTKVPEKTLGTTELSLEPSPLKLSILSEKINVFVPRSSNKIDWHDHKQIKYDNSRVGLGEQGKAAILPPDTDKELIDKLYNENGFNGLLSDKISLNRSLRDIRHEKCRTKLYLEDLPTVSVVVPFHNEHWSTLLRTASSVLYRSPKHLIKEIFLVDDASTKEFLKSKLDEYLEENMPKVKVVRLQNRSGLITARLAGARVATADVLIFLDSHTEANINWLPPLLEPIAQDYRTVVCPFIDVVAYDTFEYRPQDDGARGAFDWEFFYKRLSILPKDRENMPEPFASPVMAGGLFAISRKWFWELGGYDPGLDIWGGEQYELSFKLWQCGGRMVDAPCSRIGHIYRQFAPFPNPGHGDFVGKNYRRVAEVWMDEYAQYLYKRRPHYLQIDPGDLTDQRAIRRRLNCRSFRWFMTQIAFDLPSKYPMVEPELLAHGRIISESSELCVEGRSGWAGKAARVAPCSNDSQQEHELTWHRDVRLVSGYCWDVPDGRAGGPVLLYKCHLGGGNQMWQYLTDTHQFRHVSGSCLDHNSSAHTLFMKPCSNAQSQKWRIEHANMSALDSMPEYQPITGPLPLDENDIKVVDNEKFKDRIKAWLHEQWSKDKNEDVLRSYREEDDFEE